jgi:Putative member of DMT superfamily (DUF486)
MNHFLPRGVPRANVCSAARRKTCAMTTTYAIQYCFHVPANRIGSYEFNAAQLKTIQEMITLSAFAVFSVTYLRKTQMELRRRRALPGSRRLLRLSQMVTISCGQAMDRLLARTSLRCEPSPAPTQPPSAISQNAARARPEPPRPDFPPSYSALSSPWRSATPTAGGESRPSGSLHRVAARTGSIVP